MNGFGQPGGYLTYDNRYSPLLGGQQGGQQSSGSLFDRLSNAKQGYDTYAMISGKPSSSSYLMDAFGLGSTAPSASSAWGAGNYGAFAVPESGATSLGGGGGGGLSGFMAGPWAGLGGIAGLGLAAYLGYQHGSAQGAKYDAELRTPEAQRAIAWFGENPGALTEAGLPEGNAGPIPEAATGVGQAQYNADTRRFEINGMSVPEWNALMKKRRKENESE